MTNGTIKKIVPDKGFGFIRGPDEDVFFHFSALRGVKIEDLMEGQEVQFEEEDTAKGPRAKSVVPR